MRERILRILNALKAKGLEGLTGSIVGFRVEGADAFELKTNFTGHKTFLKYETSGDGAVIRIGLTHVFGHLDLSRTDDPTQFLLAMLQENLPSFRNSSAYLGLRAGSPYPFVCLNATHHFLDTLSDEEITELLSIAIWDLKMGFLFTFPSSVVTWDES